MKIQSTNVYRSIRHDCANNECKGSVVFKSYTYRPNGNSKFTKINPLIKYVDDVFERSLQASRRKLEPISKDIEYFTKKVFVGDTYAWDINNNNKKKYLLVLHGFSQNISNLQNLYKEINEKTPYAILAPEYRSFGGNPPEDVSPMTLLEDTTCALEYLQNELNIKPENITILGYSFGGFVGSMLASKNPNLEKLILLSSIDTLGGNALNAEKAFKKKVPTIIEFLYNYMNFLMRPIKRTINTTKYLKKVKIPVDIIYSKYDKMVGQKSQQKLAHSCKNLDGMYTMKTGGHKLDENKMNTIIAILTNKQA